MLLAARERAPARRPALLRRLRQRRAAAAVPAEPSPLLMAVAAPLAPDARAGAGAGAGRLARHISTDINCARQPRSRVSTGFKQINYRRHFSGVARDRHVSFYISAAAAEFKCCCNYFNRSATPLEFSIVWNFAISIIVHSFVLSDCAEKSYSPFLTISEQLRRGGMFKEKMHWQM